MKWTKTVSVVAKEKKEFIKKGLMLKTLQRFKRGRHNVLLKKLSRLIALSSNNDKKMQSFDLIETYAYGMGKDLVCGKDAIKK